MGSFVPWWGDYGPGRGEGGRPTEGGGMLPDVSEASTAIYTEGISPLDTWRSGSSEARSVCDLQDLAVSLPSAARFLLLLRSRWLGSRVCLCWAGKTPGAAVATRGAGRRRRHRSTPFLCRWSRHRLPMWPNVNARESDAAAPDANADTRDANAAAFWTFRAVDCFFRFARCE